ncbi:MAG: hypothetical protein AAGO57_05500, partial [Pseudomonadota bacterium]
PDAQTGETETEVADTDTKPEAATDALVDAAQEEDAPVEEAGLDTEVADILREEAELEVSQRRSEDAPPAFEPQGDLGLDDDTPSELLRERLDRMRGDGVPKSTVADTLTQAKAPPIPGPRRERLPDIEEINSSLRPNESDAESEPPIRTPELTAIRQKGFRRGFAACVIAAGIAVAAYVYAPNIVETLPSSEPAMISYVETANGLRDGIDRIMARAITGLNGL